jgi:phenylacetate-CoA ligase
MKFANESLNLMTPAQIREYQEVKLRGQLRYCFNNSDFYRQKFNAAGVHPNDIRTIKDFRKLPIFMTKEDERISQQESIQRHGHPFGMHLCAEPEDIELASTTSGTTGLPTFTYSFSKRDINGPVADLWAAMLKYVNVKPGDRVLFAFTLGIYATSMILWGIRKINAIPIDIDVRGGVDLILQFAEITRPVCALMTPSFAEYLIKAAPDSIGKEVSSLGIKSLLLCGEPGAGVLETKKRLEDAFLAKVYDFWAPGALGFGVSCNSDEYYGLHCYAPDYNLCQDDLINPTSKENIYVEDGATGELVHTSLERDACPMIRYAYGDIVQVFTKECPACGFKGKRLKFVGRSDDMLIIKGFNVHPETIQKIISTFIPKVTGHFKIVLETPPPKVASPLKIKLEYGSEVKQRQLIDLEMQIKTTLYHRIKTNSDIIWVPPDTFDRSLQKSSIFERNYKKKKAKES